MSKIKAVIRTEDNVVVVDFRYPKQPKVEPTRTKESFFHVRKRMEEMRKEDNISVLRSYRIKVPTNRSHLDAKNTSAFVPGLLPPQLPPDRPS